MKTLTIDQKIAFLGSADLCFTRYDTNEFKLTDNVQPYIFNGIDYYNPRIKGLSNIEDYKRDILDRNTQHRMPWHDVNIKVEGPAARDVAINFMEA